MKFLLIDYEHSFKLQVHFSTSSLDFRRLACMSMMIVHGIYGPESPVLSFARRWWSISRGKKNSRRRCQKQNVFSSYLTVVCVFSSNISCTQHRILQMTLTLVPLFVFVSSPGANAFRCLKSLFSFPDLSLTNLENGSWFRRFPECLCYKIKLPSLFYSLLLQPYGSIS